MSEPRGETDSLKDSHHKYLEKEQLMNHELNKRNIGHEIRRRYSKNERDKERYLND